MTIYSLPPLFTALTTLALGIAILHRNFHSKLNQAAFYWCCSTFVWLFSYSICYSVDNVRLVNVLIRIACTAVMFVSVTALHYVAVFLQDERELFFLKIVYIFNICLLPFYIFSNLFINGYNHYFFGYYGKAGPLYPFLTFFFILIIFRSLSLLYLAIKRNNLSQKKQIQTQYLFTSILIATLANVDYLPKYGIPIYPFGSFFMLCWVLITSYAILKHQLLDIRIIIRKSLLYSVVIPMISIIYLLIVILSEKFLQGIVGYKSTILSLFTAFFLGLILVPLRNKVQAIFDQFYLHGSPHEISEQNEFLRKEVAQSEKFKSISTLASGLAHEIKNPLTAIKTFAEFLPQKKDDPQFLEKFSKIVSFEVNRIDDLVHQLLDFAKPGSLELKSIDIYHLQDSILELLNSSFIKNKIEVVKYYANPASTYLFIDANQFKQALLNIILNAIDAMPQGGKLSVITSFSLTYCEILIQDTGIGIDKKDLHQVFDPFFSKKDGGTGLGLAVTYGIIREHSGNIRVESELGVGTKFIIQMPLDNTIRSKISKSSY